jgi:hypothetical protein
MQLHELLFNNKNPIMKYCILLIGVFVLLSVTGIILMVLNLQLHIVVLFYTVFYFLTMPNLSKYFLFTFM